MTGCPDPLPPVRPTAASCCPRLRSARGAQCSGWTTRCGQLTEAPSLAWSFGQGKGMADASVAAVPESHSAVLWMTGDRVRKRKKPVPLGFLDFSTLEAWWWAWPTAMVIDTSGPLPQVHNVVVHHVGGVPRTTSIPSQLEPD